MCTCRHIFVNKTNISSDLPSRQQGVIQHHKVDEDNFSKCVHTGHVQSCSVLKLPPFLCFADLSYFELAPIIMTIIIASDVLSSILGRVFFFLCMCVCALSMAIAMRSFADCFECQTMGDIALFCVYFYGPDLYI